jgi:hypothetical protein
MQVADRGSRGGAANELGSQYRGRVAAWFAAHGLAGVEPRGLDLPPSGSQPRRLRSIRLEADTAVDDIAVEFTEDIRILAQVKHAVQLHSSPGSPFVKTVQQWCGAVRRGDVRNSADRLLLVTEEPSRPIRMLGKALHRRRTDPQSSYTPDESSALSRLEQLLQALDSRQQELVLDCAVVLELHLSQDGVRDAAAAAARLDGQVVAAGEGDRAFACLSDEARDLAAKRQGRFLSSWLASLQAHGLTVVLPAQPDPTLTSGRFFVSKAAPAADATLARLLSLSGQAVQEAALLRPASSPHEESIDPPPQEHLGELRLDQLYVRRTAAEDRVLKLVRVAGTGRIILVVGDAGHGKTSLLWWVHGELAGDERVQPLFIKASYLDAAPPGHGSLGPMVSGADLLLAAQAARDRGLLPVVLLDTVDVLLHGEQQEDRVLELLGELQRAGSVVIVASRPAEAGVLSPTVVESGWVALGRYTEPELQQAVLRHSRHFYRRVVGRDPSEEAARILKAVSTGRPLREVCLGPLTLRMLFDLYAPHEIEDEIHVAQLYHQFWEYRVREDRRAARASSGAGTRDLTSVAAAAALVMLAEGKPELSTGGLQTGLAQLGIQPTFGRSGLRELMNRGVMAGSRDRCHFFHQTFFEHAAAHAFVDEGRGGLSLLFGHVHQIPDDPFLAPIVEHALLLALAPDQLSAVSRIAEAELVAMLQHAADTPRHSALYVYAHASRATVQLRREVQAVLARGDAATSDTFVRSAVNMPTDRLDALFVHLDAIWTNGTWREQQHIIELLERLSVRSPEKVALFLERHAVLDVVTRTEGAVSAVARVLVRTFAGIASDATSAAPFAWVTRLLHAAPSNRGGRRPVAGREMYANVLSTLAEPAVADAFGAADLASRLMPVLTHRLNQIREGEKIFQAYGAIWVCEWRARQLDVGAVLASLNHERPVVESAQYHALVDALMPASEQEARLALQRFLDEPLHRQFRWVSVVIPRMLRRWADTPGDSGPARWPPVVDAFVQWIASQLARPLPTGRGGGRRWRSDLGVLARQALENAHLYGPPLREILDLAGSIDDAAWLDKDRLAGLLTAAALAGHPTAAHALASARADPLALADGVAYRVVAALQERLKEASDAETALAADAFLDICLGTDDADRMAEWLPSLAMRAPTVAAGRAADLEHASQRLLDSPSALARRGAARLWLVLLQQQLLPSPLLTAVRHRLDAEHDVATTAVLLRVIAYCRIESNAELQMARSVLDSAAAEAEAAVKALRPGSGPAERQGTAVGQEYRRNEAVRALTELLATHIDQVGAEAVMEAASRRPVNVERIEICTRLAERLISTGRVDEGAAIIRAWGKVGADQESGTKVRKNIAAYLGPALNTFFRRAPEETWTDLLHSLGEFDEHFTRAVVDAACRQRFVAALPVLVGLLNATAGDGEADNELPSRVRRLILGYRHERERTRGNAGWPELLDAFPPLAAPPS